MKKLGPILICAAFTVCTQAAQLPVPLGTAGNFTILGASTVTNTGPSIIRGEVGVSPSTAITGFPPGQVIGGSIHSADGPAAVAQSDLTIAYNDAAGRTLPALVAGDLGGLTLTPGLYKSTSSLGITGVLRLDGQGDVNSVFIIQVASALTTASGSQIILQGGAQAANIFWQVGSSATLGTNSIFNGTILAQASVSLATGAALNGRALARTAAVTLDSNTSINPGPPTVNIPPPLLTVNCPLNSAQVGLAYNSLLVATGGVPPYTYSITGLLPAGLSLNSSTGAITGTPTAAGISAFVARALDSAAGTASSNCSITVTAPVVPSQLSVTCPASPAQSGVAYSSSLLATGGTPPYTFSITGALPAGLSLNTSTGVVTGTPTTAGTSSFTARAVDSVSANATAACTILITAPVVTPTLSVTCPASAGQTGVAYSSSLIATGGTPGYTFSVTGSLPAGLSLNTSTGAVTGTPTTAGTSPFTARAVDSASVNATAACTIVITAPVVTPTLSVSCPASTGQTGVAYNSSLVAMGGVPGYTFSITGTLPAGLTLNTATGALTGTPTAAGTSSIAVKATDSTSVSATRACSIVISAPVGTPGLTVSCPANSAQIGVAYNSSLAAAGGTPPYAYSITGSLPPGLSLNATTGAITGTPSVGGANFFSAKAADAASTNASQDCSIVTPSATNVPPPVPAPSSLILVLIGLGCTLLYQSRERLMGFFRRS